MSVRAWIYESREFDDVSPLELEVEKLSSFGLQTEDPFIFNTILKKATLECLNFSGALDYLRYKRASDPFEVLQLSMDNGGWLEGSHEAYTYYRVLELSGNYTFRNIEYSLDMPTATTGLYCVPPSPYNSDPEQNPMVVITSTDDRTDDSTVIAQLFEPLFLKIEIDNGTDPVYTGYYYLDFTMGQNCVEFDDENSKVTINAEPIEGLLLRLLEHIDPWNYLVNTPEYDLIRKESSDGGELTANSEEFYDGVSGEIAYYLAYLYSAKEFLTVLFNYCGFAMFDDSLIPDFGFVNRSGTASKPIQREKVKELSTLIMNLLGGDIEFLGSGVFTIRKQSGAGTSSPVILDQGRTLTKEASYTTFTGKWIKIQEVFHLYLPVEMADAYGRYVFTFILYTPVVVPNLFLFKKVGLTWRAGDYTQRNELINNSTFNYTETVTLTAQGLFTGLRKTFTYMSKTHLVVSIDYDEEADQSELICRVID